MKYPADGVDGRCKTLGCTGNHCVGGHYSVNHSVITYSCVTHSSVFHINWDSHYGLRKGGEGNGREEKLRMRMQATQMTEVTKLIGCCGGMSRKEVSKTDSCSYFNHLFATGRIHKSALGCTSAWSAGTISTALLHAYMAPQICECFSRKH